MILISRTGRFLRRLVLLSCRRPLVSVLLSLIFAGLRTSSLKFPRVAYRIDPKSFEGRQLLYLPTEELKEIRDRIFDHQEFMESFAGDPSLARLVEGANAAMASAFVSNLFDLGLEK